MSVILAENLCKTYNGRQVVHNFCCELRCGEVVGILGPNGAGKTTSFYMISGLIAPQSGKIFMDGHDITAYPMYKRARLGLGYLPQESSIFRGLNVEQNLRAVLEIVDRDKKNHERKIDELLSEFKILHLKKSPAVALSGGERRRLEIARALCASPKFILFDEPFAGVDPIAVGDIKNLILQLAQRNIGIFITDHNVRETLSMVNRAYIMHQGRELAHGTSMELIQNKLVRNAYLGQDFTL